MTRTLGFRELWLMCALTSVCVCICMCVYICVFVCVFVFVLYLCVREC